MQRHNNDAEDAAAQEVPWLTAYADLITAILAVILLMLTFAPINMDELASMVLSDPANARTAPSLPSPEPAPESEPTAPGVEIDAELAARVAERASSLAKLQRELYQIAERHGLTDAVTLHYDHLGLEVAIESVALFDVGSAELAESQLAPFLPLFARIARASQRRYVDIQGHTDDTGEPAFNWRLSADRALSMLQFLEQRGLATEGVRLIAYADTRPRRSTEGLGAAALEEARNANRRISLLIHRRRDPSD
jgi:flagellar motor protein MotB